VEARDNLKLLWKRGRDTVAVFPRAIVTDILVAIAKFDAQRRAMEAADRAEDFFESRAEDDFDDSEAELEATDDDSVTHALRRLFVEIQPKDDGDGDDPKQLPADELGNPETISLR
jgi:hypothetical protein